MLNRDRTGKTRDLLKKMALFRTNTSDVRRDVDDFVKGAFSGAAAATAVAQTKEEIEELLKVALRLRLVLLQQVIGVG